MISNSGTQTAQNIYNKYLLFIFLYKYFMHILYKALFEILLKDKYLI